MPLGTIDTGVTISGSGLALALNAKFRETYQRTFAGIEQYYRDLFESVPSTMALETYAYRKTAPYASRWPNGSTRGTKGMGAVRWSVVNHDWTNAVAWNRNDKDDDLLRSLEQDARGAGQHFATLWARINAQIKEGATNADLLPSIPNAPDGVDLYNATDGDGGSRFGVSGGNLITGTGVSNAGQIRKDWHRILARFKDFQDTEGQPLIDPSWFTAGYLIEYPTALTEVMREAFIQSRTTHQLTATGTQAPTSSGLAGHQVSNVILESGDSVVLWCNQWLTDAADWYVTLRGAPIKPLIHQNRQPLREILETMDVPGAEHATRTKEEAIWWDTRDGYGVALPFQTIACV